jgi:hypothetical protein
MKNSIECFYAFARRKTDGQWVMLYEFKTRGQAEAILHRVLLKYGRRYRKTDLRILSESEASQFFGANWKNQL